MLLLGIRQLCITSIRGSSGLKERKKKVLEGGGGGGVEVVQAVNDTG